MLKIRPEQAEALDATVVPDINERLFSYLRVSFFKHFCFLGEEAFQKVIRNGRERAKVYGIHAEYSLRIYFGVIFKLGSGFADDLQYPWAKAILGSPTPADPHAKMDRLLEKANHYAAHVANDYRGADADGQSTGFIEELGKLRHERDAVLSERECPEFRQRLLERFRKAFPGKSSYLGPDTVRALIQSGRDSAAGYGITTERGVTFFIALMFAVGSGFHKDPLLPWVEPILNDGALNQTEKIDRLYHDAVKSLKKWWATEG